MEADLVITLRCQNKKHRSFVRKMLSDDAKRPLFEEEVAKSERDWFNALEDVESADWVKAKKGETLHAGWLLDGDYEKALMEIERSLCKAGVQEVRAVVAGDEGWFQLWLQHDGKLKEYSNWRGAELDELFDEEGDMAKVLDSLES